MSPTDTLKFTVTRPTCEDSQICTTHEIVMFGKNPRKGRDGKPDPDPKKGNLYYVPKRNPRMGRLEVNTLPKKDFYPVQINEIDPQCNYVHYRKPRLLDVLVENRPDMTWKDYWRRTMMLLLKMRGRLEPILS